MKLIAAALTVLVLSAFPAAADVAGSLSAGTDMVIMWAQAGLTLLIIVCCVMAAKGGNWFAVVALVIVGAAIVNARDISSTLFGV